MTPTISQVEASKPATLVDAGGHVFGKAGQVQQLMRQARAAGDEYAHHSKGTGETARREHLYLEQIAGSHVVQQMMAIARTMEGDGHQLDTTRKNLLDLRAEIQENGFGVNDDGGIVCTYKDNDPGKDAKIAKAHEYFDRVQQLLRDYEQLDAALADALHREIDALGKLAKGESEKVDVEPVVGENARDQARRDADAVNRGDLSDEEARRVVEDLVAAGLTPEQAEAKLSGQDVRLGQEQSDYLDEFYRDVRGDKLEALSERFDGVGGEVVQQALTDGLLTAMSPKTKFADGTSGGIMRAPKDLREFLLSPPPLTTMFGQGYGDWQSQVGQIDRLSGMLGHGSADAAQGSEANLGLLLKSSQFTDPPQGMPSADSAVQKALTVAGRDHTSDSMLLNPAAHGGSPESVKYVEEARDRLLAHQYADQGAALSKLVDWIPGDAIPHADGPGGQAGAEFRAEQAGHAARGVADAAISTGGAGPNVYDALQRNPNPQFTQALGGALAPYLPELAQADAGSTQTRGFGQIDQPNHYDNARKLFGVIDSDQTAASQFNAQALANAQLLEEQYAQAAAHGENQSQMLGRAGVLEGLVKGGLQSEADFRTHNMTVDAATAQREAGIQWDMAKTAAGKIVGSIPVVGGALSLGMDELNGYVKDHAVPQPGYVPPQNPKLDFTTDTTHDGVYYNMAQGLIQTGQPIPPQLSAFVDPATGQLKALGQIASEGHEGAFHNAVEDYLRSRSIQDGTLAKGMTDLDDVRTRAQGIDH